MHINNISRLIIQSGNHVLLAKAVKSNGEAFYFLPGGHIEHNESAIDAGIRELGEEAGIDPSQVHNIEHVGVYEQSFDLSGTPYHEIAIVSRCDIPDLDPAVPVVARERKLEFEWQPIDELDRINLLPPDFKRLVPQWASNQAPKNVFYSDGFLPANLAQTIENHSEAREHQVYEPLFYTQNDGQALQEALGEITDLVIVAHPDDAEIMAADKIHECAQDPDRKLGVIVLTDGQGAPRKGEYADFSNAELAHERAQEQVSAAIEGNYHAVVMLGHPDLENIPVDMGRASDEICELLKNCSNLRSVVTHNPFDKHPGHMATVSSVVEALRALPESLLENIEQIRGGEVWGELSWVGEQWLQKSPLAEGVMAKQLNLLRHHVSQTEGSMDYLAAIEGREKTRKFFEGFDGVSVPSDQYAGLLLGMDLLPFVQSDLRLDTFVEQVATQLVRDSGQHAGKFADPIGLISTDATAIPLDQRMSRIGQGR
jgi:LmbE family N-acetylglucosaminyl deacetylase/8-oxo-dGTP pyrophosphatase MutT (NUDIX family)